ncbi:tRNA wybutosine-synthesizing protein 3 homolog [Trichonephila inaurata madagascariensis]|uniref:tRNA wybutosine-synthesizing protein 3 homolog n=1 Tax=Trichonephila inaurata madagascariensis TaxID=2747483 RepID=A0A8X6YUV8_9ARAC|nr:tRNA wybutosine-synthesizing protein 3 homolog [Trichonephila inaurata madagascariensis]
MEFNNKKEIVLRKEDLSRKGSIDEKIVELVDFINAQDCYVTTSSCSGRISVFVPSEQRKKGCNWLFLSHDIVSFEDVNQALENHSGSAALKFEPFVLHVQCSNVEAAQKLHTASLESGFRNSGLSISKKGKIISAVRSTLSLEVPLSCDGKLLVSHEYISYVVNICNEKMKENFERIDRLFLELKRIFVQPHIKAELEEVNDNPLFTKDLDRPATRRENKNQVKNNCNHVENSISPDLFFESFDNLLNDSAI